MEPKRTFAWSRFAVLGLLVSTAALAVIGVCVAFLHLPEFWAQSLRFVCVAAFACVAGFALGVAQSATALLTTLKGRPERQWAFWIAFTCASLCGLVSLAGAHLGYGVLANQDLSIDPKLVDLAGLGLAFVKPAMSFVISEAGAVDDELRAEAEAAELERRAAADAQERANRHEENMARISGQAAPVSSKKREPTGAGFARPASEGSGPKLVKTAVNSAAGLLIAGALLTGGEPAHATPTSATTEPAANDQSEPPVIDRALARSLIAQGIAPKIVSDQTNVPHGSCKRMAWEFKNGRWAA